MYAPAGGVAPSAPGSAGKGMSIAGLILAFLVAPVGFILSIIGLVQASRGGGSKGLAIAGIIVSIVMTIATIVLVLAITFTVGAYATCATEGPGTYHVGWVTVNCS